MHARALYLAGPLGPLFRTFFPRKIPRNFLEKRFFKTFSAENLIFSQHFWGKIFRENFRGIFPGKNVQKIGPRGFLQFRGIIYLSAKSPFDTPRFK
jgi:hypothetical protein